jgi:hypothetical protein
MPVLSSVDQRLRRVALGCAYLRLPWQRAVVFLAVCHSRVWPHSRLRFFSTSMPQVLN